MKQILITAISALFTTGIVYGVGSAHVAEPGVSDNLQIQMITDSETELTFSDGSVKWIPRSVTPDSGLTLSKRANSDRVNVKCNLKGNEIYTPFRYFVYNSDIVVTKTPGEKINIPKGTYDICAEFYTGNYDEPYFARVILEDVKIEEAQTFELDVEDACNVIMMYTAGANGARLLLPNATDPDAAYDIDKMMVYTIAAHESYNYFSFGVGEASFIGKAGSAEQAFGFRVNNVSDKYHFMQARLIRCADGVVMYHCPEVSGSNVTHLDVLNSGASVVTIEEDFELTPLSRDYNRMEADFMSQGLALFKGKDVGGFSATFGGEKCRLRAVDNTVDNPKTLCQQMVVAGALDIQDLVLSFDENGNMTGRDALQTGVLGCPMIFEKGSIKHINPNNTAIENTSILYPANSFLHGHDSFCFAHEAKAEKYNDNTPATIATIKEALLSNGSSTFDIKINSIGRWGENRQSDMYQMGCVLKDGDDKTLYEGTHHNLNGNLIENIGAGVTKFKLQTINRNIEIDGQATLSTMEMEWDMSKKDPTPPVLTMLQTKHIDGDVKTRFETAAECVIEFTACDFGWDSDAKCFYDNGDIAINAEIAPCGGKYTELKVNEIPDLYHLPAFGHFYRADINDIHTEGWHNLRISLTDAAGNKQTQTLERALYINKSSGISHNVDNEFISYADNTIQVSQPTDIEIFDINGRRVLRARVEDSYSLTSKIASGIYVLRCNGDENRSISTVFKLIVK